jgi:carboxylesterase type B
MGTNNQLKLPLLIGHNADEGLFYVRDLPKTLEDYRTFVRARFPAELVDAVLARYPAATDAEVTVAPPLLDGDSRLVAPTVLTARAASKVSDVFMYRFSRVAPSSRSAWGAPHIPPKSRTSSTTRVETPHNSKRSHGIKGNGSGVSAVREYRESKRWRVASMACVPLT